MSGPALRSGVPSSTYRVQFRSGFGFSQARELVGYLHDLGAGALYASPAQQARLGSGHGYDVTDPARLDASLGTLDDFVALAGDLRVAGMGLVLDIVPNHMAASTENAWWDDVLARGRLSRYAGFFDVDWDAHDGKVLLPVLGAPYADVLERGELKVVRGRLAYHGLRLPLAEGSSGRGAVDSVVARQHYIPAYWRAAAEEVSYRRFFDIGDLVSLRTDSPGVFEATHELVVRLVRDGHVTGLRVDHVDGLADPRSYLARLRRETGAAYVVVEKILGRDEALPANWSCDGTTGYEIAGAVDELLVDAAGVARLEGGSESFEEVEREAKRTVVRELFPADFRRLTRAFEAAAREDRWGRDLTSSELRRALEEVCVALSVYRTYISHGRVTRADRDRIEAALDRAAAALGPDGAPGLRFVRRVLLGRRWPELAGSWQRLTGPVTAKGVEDTALYRFPRLVSLNEVGGHPGTAPDPGRLHALNVSRAARWRGGMSAGSTHDSKRSEDVRARIDVLSEIPDRWTRTVRRWDAWTSALRPGERALELLAYQTLLGAWPLDDSELEAFPDRFAAYLRKAAREAKARTSWLRPDEGFEERLEGFARTLVSDERIVRDVEALLRTVGFAGALNSLAGVVLRMASPGVPDVYQGCELWCLSLVDPDNRRPVDFAFRRRLLAALPDDPVPLLRSWPDGRVKLFVTTRLLQLRRQRPALLGDGDYLPLRARGTQAAHVVAFARRRRDAWAVAVVPRLTTRLAPAGRPPVGDKAWTDTVLRLPAGAPTRFVDELTGREVRVVRGGLQVSSVLETFPVAVLTTQPATATTLRLARRHILTLDTLATTRAVRRRAGLSSGPTPAYNSGTAMDPPRRAQRRPPQPGPRWRRGFRPHGSK